MILPQPLQNDFLRLLNHVHARSGRAPFQSSARISLRCCITPYVQIFDAVLQRADHLLKAALVLDGDWVLVLQLDYVRDYVQGLALLELLLQLLHLKL